MARHSADVWIALALIALSGVFLNELFDSEASGAFVKTTTLPIALAFVLLGLSTLLLVGALLQGAPTPAESSAPAEAEPPPPLWRVAAMVIWIAFYIAMLPVAGYLLASGGFLIGASLLYGNRRWPVILCWAVVLPTALLLFFEKVMIVLLPSSRLLG